jgi:hypothetical protein
MLKPGTYKLSIDVENPCADLNKKYDWRFFPVWRAGLEFIVEDPWSSYGAWSDIRWALGKEFQWMDADDPRYVMLAKALVLIGREE